MFVANSGTRRAQIRSLESSGKEQVLYGLRPMCLSATSSLLPVAISCVNLCNTEAWDFLLMKGTSASVLYDDWRCKEPAVQMSMRTSCPATAAITLVLAPGLSDVSSGSTQASTTCDDSFFICFPKVN